MLRLPGNLHHRCFSALHAALIRAIVLWGCVATARAAPPPPGGPASAFPPGRVILAGGVLKEIQDLHHHGMVGELEPDRLLFKFRAMAGLPQPGGITRGYGGWDDGFIAGHYAGHYLSGASRLYAATGDTAFRGKVLYMVSVLAECQQALGGGYLSAFPEAKFDRLEANPRGGSVEYYTIHKVLAGLVDAARICGDDLAYQMASRMSDHFAARMAKLTPEQTDLLLRTDYTGNPVNEFGGMAEALTDLFLLARERGDERADRHLDFARVFIRDWLVEPLLRGEDRLDGLHGNTHAAQAASIARFALVTGREREARAARQFFDFLVRDHSFVNGGNSFHEKLRAPGVEVAGEGPTLLNALTAESCNTHNMLKLARHLGCISPDCALPDYAENALYNHLVATVAPDDGRVTYYLSMRPGDHRVHVPDPVCCQGTGIELAGRLAEGLYTYCGEDLWVHGYADSTLDWREKRLRLRQETRYPEDGAVRIHLEADVPVGATLHLRMPGWLDALVEVRLNGVEIVSGVPGSYLSLAREWKNGDVLSFVFPMKLRVRPARDARTMVSFFHGPLLLAGKLGCEGMPASDVQGHMALENAPAWPAPVSVTPHPEEPRFDLRPLHDALGEYEVDLTDPRTRKPVTVRLGPFFRVHHERYALYWRSMTPADLESALTAQTREAGSFIGRPELEQAVQLQGERSHSGIFRERRWRDAAPDGWFSYRLPIPREQDVRLVCTYWGGESIRREFDVLVEDRLVATQVLENNRPDEFFDTVHPLPDDLLHGRQFVTIRFQSKGGFLAGGLFGLRLEAPSP